MSFLIGGEIREDGSRRDDKRAGLDGLKQLHLDLICLNDRSFSESNFKGFITKCHLSALGEREEL